MSLFILTACSGTGKSTLVKSLLAQHQNLRLSVSHTTRAPRPGEENHVVYHFINHDQFQEMIAQDAFVEWAEFAGNLYGTSHQMIQEAQEAGYDLLFEVEIQGADRLKDYYPQAISCFVLPPSWESLAQRLRGRNTESESIVQKRLQVGYQEIHQAEGFDYLVINDDFDEALSLLSQLYVEHKIPQNYANQLLQNLLHSIPKDT